MLLISIIAITLFLFAIGAAVGSFLNVVIYRTMTEESWVKGRSKCEDCGYQLRWFDNIPLVSFLWLRGRCRKCRKSIALIHPVVEFLTGALFVWWYWGGTLLFFRLTEQPFQLIQPAFWLGVGVLLLMIVVADLSYLIIPDLAVGLLLVTTLTYRVVLTWAGVMQMSDLVWSLLAAVGAAVFFGGLWVVTKGRGMGLGDVKLVGPLALLMGWPNSLVGFFLAFISGAVVGVCLLLLGKKRFGQVVPFGPFLVLGTVLALVWGDGLSHWYIGLL